MAKKTKLRDTDFLSLSSMLAAREAKMLTREKANRMLDAPTFEECAKLLTDCGYEDLSSQNADGIEDALEKHRAEIMTELAKMSPSAELIDFFRVRYDYHNAKVLIKAQGVGEDPGHLLSGAGRVSPEVIRKSFESGEDDGIPPILWKAMQESAGILARTANPQAADLCLDHAYFEELTAMAAAVGNDFFTGYVAVQADAVNLRTLVRLRRMKKSNDFLKTALVNGGSVSPEVILAAHDGGAAEEAFAATPLKEAAALGRAAAAGEGSLTVFELAADNAVTAYLGSASLRAFGAEAVIRYLARLENEISAVRMILTGRLAGISSDVIRERVRDIC